MRTIKFRGKSIDTQEWVYGDLETAPTKEYSVIHTYKEDETYKGQVKVVKESVGQYTGYKDSKGTEIYEGDILEVYMPDYDEKYKTQVTFEDGAFLVDIKRQDYDTVAPIGWWFDNYRMDDDCVVVGNIHDNPELLK